MSLDFCKLLLVLNFFKLLRLFSIVPCFFSFILFELFTMCKLVLRLSTFSVCVGVVVLKNVSGFGCVKGV